MRIKLNKKLLVRKEDGSVNRITINQKDYYKFILPKGCDFGNTLDENGNEVGKLPDSIRASFIVPVWYTSQAIEGELCYIDFPDNYKYLKITLDLGKSEERLEDGRHKHLFSAIENISPNELADIIEDTKWLSFTVSVKQLGKPYQTEQGNKRISILLPKHAGDLMGCRATISQNCIKEIKGRDDIKIVNIPKNSKFNIMRSKIVGQDIENQMKPVFGDKIIEATVTGKELFELFKKPNEYEEQTTHEVESEEMEQGL